MNEYGRRKKEYCIMAAVIAAACMFVFLTLENSAPILGLLAFFVAAILFALYAPKKAHAAARLCFRYRWAIALLLFVLCVALRISGSSIGIYDEIFPTQIQTTESTWFGVPRRIRSDEYGVATPQFFSQAYNGYSLYSDRMSLSPTNMVLDYYSPVWDAAAFGKPLMWGYLLFGNMVGLSWYWCGLVILLFMTALETVLILTRGCKWISVVGAAVVTLAPAIQWWMLPHMPIVILYAMALFCIGYYFFTAEKALGKWGFSALAAMAAVGFGLSVFPSFQVPCAYAVIILLAACLIRDRAKITFRIREWYRIAIPAAVALGIIVRFVIVSKDDISLLMNTAYPGRRVDLGGTNALKDLFTDITSLFLPYHTVEYSNNCEVSTYIHFAPAFILLLPRICVYLKRRRSPDIAAGAALGAILIFYGFYMCVGIPPFLAKITLLRFCNRMKGVYGWLAALFTLWGVYIVIKYPDILTRRQKRLYPCVYGFLSILLLDENTLKNFLGFGELYGIQIGIVRLFAAVAGMTGLLLLALLGKKRLTACGFIAVMVVSGLPVNPIEYGTGAVTNHPISACITQVSKEEPDALWLCTDCASFISNYAAANGARVLNAVNFYPDVKKWEILDPDDEFKEYTNRYANQCAFLADSDPSVRLVAPDQIHCVLTPDMLQALNIRYLLSTVDHTELLNDWGIACECLMRQDGYGIYRLY